MVKKKKQQKNNTKFRPVVIQKATMDSFLNLPPKDRANAIALYCFYCATANWQRTNQPYCTDSFVAGKDKTRQERKGLGWDVGKVARVRKILENMKIIEKLRDGVTGKTFIKIKFYPSEKAVISAENSSMANSGKTRVCHSSHPIANSGKAKSGFSRVNAYRYNNINAYKNNNVTGKPVHGLIDGKEKKSFEERCTIKLKRTLQLKRKLCKKVNKKQWMSRFRNLYKKHDIKKSTIKNVLKWYCKNIGKEFVPLAFSAKTFCSKFPNIEEAMNRVIKKEEKIKGKYKYTKTIVNR